MNATVKAFGTDVCIDNYTCRAFQNMHIV